MLQHGARADRETGHKLLQAALREDNLDLAVLLLQDGARADKKPGNELQMRAAKGDKELLTKLLLQDGAEKECKDIFGRTPLSVAASENSLQVAELLLKQGSDKETRDIAGRTPLSVSASENSVEVALMLLKQGADVNRKDNRGNTPLLTAVKEGNVKCIEALLKHRADVNIKNNTGDTPLWIAAQKNHVEIARLLYNHGADAISLAFRAVHKSNVNIVQFLIELGVDVDSKDDDGDTFLIKAVKSKSLKVAQILLQNEADISVRDETGRSSLFHIQQNMSSNYVKQMFLDPPEVWKLSDPAIIIEHLEISEEYESDLKSTLNNILGQAIDKLASVIDDPKRRFLFYRGDLYCRLIKIFLNRGGDDTSLLRTIYIALQAKVKCDQPKKVMLKNELDSIPGLYESFHDRLDFLTTDQIGTSELPDSSVSSELADLKIIAEQIYSEYFKEKKSKGILVKIRGFFETVASKLKSCCCRKNDKQRIKAKTKKTKKEGEDCCPSLPTEVYHKCTARDKITVMFCLLGIVFYILDLYTDVVVGLEDLRGFSQKLGIFELFLVVFTLCHENYRSSNSVYATRGELLRIEVGKFDLEDKDWKRTELNWSGNRYIRGFYMFCCPFKVKGTAGFLNKLKAILYNILTCLQLRPVVDRLVVLLHAPTNLRDYYRRQSEQNCLKQFYLILEQLPELLVQFYTFQIVYNNLSFSELKTYTSDSCYDYFAYGKLNSNYTNDTNSFCKNLSLSDDGLTTCSTLFRLFSMAIPFYNIPSGIASLENGFRRLDPLTPKMSSSLKAIFQATYMMMIPARVFMFAGAMHAVRIKEYVFGYLILRAILELLVNLYTLYSVNKDYPAYLKGSIGKKASTMWRLCLFSIRDVFLISIRDPAAYLSKPSEVSNSSLRNWTNFALRVIPFLCEGLVAAVLIEIRYPCGKHSHNFRYLGWFCLILLLFVVPILAMISDLFLPKKIHSSCSTLNNLNYMKRSLLIGFISIMISGTAALAFTLTQPRSFVELVIMGVAILLNILLNIGLILFIKKLSSVKQVTNDSCVEEVEGKEIDDEITVLKECVPLLELTSNNSSPFVGHMEENSSTENDELNIVEVDENESVPILDQSSSVENIALMALKNVSSTRNDNSGIFELDEATPLLIVEPSKPNLVLTVRVDQVSRDVLEETSSEENEECQHGSSSV